MYELVLSLNFKKAYNKLPKTIQERLKKILKKLRTKLFGNALKGDLKGFYSIHFENNKYRLIYYKENNTIQVLLVHVGKRTERFYKDFKKELHKSMKKKSVK